MPAMPAGATDGILKGLYKLPSRRDQEQGAEGPPVRQRADPAHTLRAQEMLAEQFGVAADVWSATSYKRAAPRRAGGRALEHAASRSRPPRHELPARQLLAREEGVFLAASDYMRSVPEMIGRWVPGGLFAAGHRRLRPQRDRAALRRHFEVDAECITVAALWQLAQRGALKPAVVQQAIQKFGINPEKISPMRA